MATMSGPDFRDKHPHAHLVIGEYDRAWVINPETEQTRLGLLMRLAKAIDVTGDYTMTDKVADGVIPVSFATAEEAAGKREVDASPCPMRCLFAYSFDNERSGGP